MDNKEGGQASGILGISLQLSKKTGKWLLTGYVYWACAKLKEFPANSSLPFLHIFKIQ